MRGILPLAVFVVLACASPVVANEPDALNDYAVTLMERGDHDKALEKLQQAFSLNSYDPVLKKNLAEAYAYVGRQHLDRNRFEEAATYFDNARELFPDNARFATLRGMALYFAKQYDAAAFELERARLDGGDTIEVLYFLGKVRYDTEDLRGAVAEWEKALALDPENKVIRQVVEKARREMSVEDEMDRGYSSRFNISHDSAVKPELADSILDVLETAYNRVGSDLDHFPTARVPVILYASKDYRAVTASPDWSGGMYDGKIRLPIGGAPRVEGALSSVLFHEYAHVVVRELSHGNCPPWLNEGIAELQGRREHNQPLRILPKAFRAGTLLSFADLERSFLSLEGEQAILAYEQSYSIVNYFIAAYGWHKVRETLVNLGKGMPIEAAVGKALGDYAVDYRSLEAEWRNHLLKELGR